MGSTEATEPQGVDVVRNLDGIPLGLDEIEKFVLSEEKRGKTKLKGYSVPESGAWRGLMSNGGRIILDWEQGDNHKLPSSVFYKVCFEKFSFFTLGPRVYASFFSLHPSQICREL